MVKKMWKIMKNKGQKMEKWWWKVATRDWTQDMGEGGAKLQPFPLWRAPGSNP